MLQLGRLGQHRNQRLGGFHRPLPLQSPPRPLRLKHEAQGNGLRRALKLCPERAALGVKADLLFGHQLVADGQPLAVKPLGSLMKGRRLVRAELSRPVSTTDQNGVRMACGVKTETPPGPLLNLQAQPGSRAG